MLCKSCLSFVAAVGGCLLTIGAARAASVIYVDMDATGPVHDGTTWCQAYTSLSEAIDVAQAGDTIRVADGTYKPDPTGLEDPSDATFSLQNGVRIEGGYAGCGAPDPDARDVAFYETLLDGDLNDDDTSPIQTDCFEEHEGFGCDNEVCEAIVCDVLPECCEDLWPWWDSWGYWCVDVARAYCCEQVGLLCDNAYHVASAVGTDASAALHGVTVTAGHSRGPRRTPEGIGGGILIANGSATISSCTVTGNSSRGSGAGVGIHEATATITDCVIATNTAHGSGGGMSAYLADLTISGSVIRDNTAGGGGGMDLYFVNPVSIDDSVISGNLATKSDGGGISASETNLTLTNSTISENTCTIYGGAGIDASFTALSVVNCAFIANGSYAHLSYTGAMELGFSSADIRSTLILANLGMNTGGVVLSYASARFSNCTIAFNVATQSILGAGLNQRRYNSTMTVENCILWGNNANGRVDEGAQIYPDRDRATVSYNDIQGWNGYYGGVGNFGLDPMFVDPTGPDGLSGTADDDLRLEPGSPCINRGDPAFVPLEGEVDLNGEPRLQGCRVDLGAYETNTEQLLGDFNADDNVDLRDVAHFQNCFHAGIQNPDWLEACLCVFDFNEDSVIDAADYPRFWTVLTTR